MLNRFFKRSVGSSFGRRVSKGKRPLIEVLEDRTVPATFTWGGGTGDWATPANWNVVGSDVDGIPDADDDTTIASGSATISGAAAALSLTVTGGTLTLGAGLAVDTADFSAGTGTVGAPVGSPLTVSNQFKLSGAVTATIAGGTFAVTGSNIVLDSAGESVKRTITTSGGTLSFATASAPAVTGINYFKITNDATSGLSNTNTYTHAINPSGGSEIVNTIPFTGAAGGTVTSLTAKSYTASGGGTVTINNSIASSNFGATAYGTGLGSPTWAGIPAGGMLNVFSHFNYGTAPLRTVVLTGLTPNTWYDVRLYQKQWDNTSGRTFSVGYDVGNNASTEATSPTIDQNQPQNTAALASLGITQSSAWALSYVYKTGAAETSIKLDVNNSMSATHHFYALSNQIASLGGASGAALPNTSIVVSADTTVQGTNMSIDSLNVVGGATLSLSGVASFNLKAFGSGSGTIRNSVPATSAGMTIANASSTTFSGTILSGGGNGSINVVKTTGGTLILSNPNITYGGALTISGGTVQLGDGVVPLTSLPNVAITNNATLAINNSSGNVNGAAAISGSGAVTLDGAGTVSMTVASTYTGATTITNGTVNASGTALGVSNVTFNAGGVLNLAGNLTVGSIASAASVGSITLNGNQLTTGATAASTSFGGLISGTGTGSKLVKSGTGTLTLAAGNTFEGSTTITGGTLVISADTALGTAPGSVTAGQLVLNGGALRASASLTLASSRGIAVGPSSGTGSGQIEVAAGQTVGFTGTIANNGGGTGALNVGSSGNTGTLDFTGATTSHTGATTISFGIFNFNGALAILNVNGSGANVNVGAGAKVTSADFSSGVGTVVASNPLEITSLLLLPGAGLGPYVPGGGATSFTASGSNIASNSLPRTVTVSGGSLPMTGAPVNVGLNYFKVTGDADSGLSTLNTYTHVVNPGGSGSTTVNSIPFANTVNSVKTYTNPNTGLVTVNNSFSSALTDFGTSNQTANYNGWSNVTGNMLTVMGNFRHDSTTRSVVLTGLTQNTWYDVRLLEKEFSAGAGRTFTVNYDVGNNGSIETVSPTIDQNNPQNTAALSSVGIGQQNAWMMSYVYRTGAGQTSIRLLIDNPNVANSYHFYGVTNQVVPVDFVSLANTSFVVTASSSLDFGNAAKDHTIGSITLQNSGTALQIGGANSVSVASISSSGVGNSISNGSGTPIVAIKPTGDVNVTSGDLTINAKVSNFPNNGGTVAITPLAKNGAGTLVLTGANTYTGVSTLSAGVLSVATIGDGGVSSGNLGSATNAAANLVFDGGELLYTGATASSNRNFTINIGKTATFHIAVNTLTLSGAAAASDGGLTKLGTGTLTLGGANLYTGNTAVNAGVLRVAGSLAATNVTVTNAGSGLTMGNNAAIGGSVTLNADTTLVTDILSTITGGLAATDATITVGGAGTVGALNLGGPLSADDTTTFNFDFLNAASYDTINAGANAATITGTPTFNLAGSGIVSGTYPLISYDSISGAFDTALDSTPGGLFAYALNTTPTALNLVVTPTIPSLVWDQGGAGSPIVDGLGDWITGSTEFFDVTSSAAATFNNPDSYDVTFGNGGAGGIITLTGNVRTGGLLIFAPVTTPYTIGAVGGTNTLTTAGGVVANHSATLFAPVLLETSQPYLVGSGQTLTIDGTLGESAASALTKSGPGVLLLNGLASYSLGTTVSAGTFRLGAANRLPATSSVSLANVAGTAFDLNNFNQTLGSLSGGGALGGNVALGSGTLTVGDSSSTTYGGVIGGAGGLTKEGSGTLTLTHANTYSGPTNINDGVIDASVANTFASGAVININTGGTLNATAAGAFNGVTINIFSGGNLNVLATDALSGATIVVQGGTVALGSFNSAVASLTLQSGDVTGTGTLTAAANYDIQTGSISAVLAGTVDLVKSTSGTAILSGVSTYTGATTVNAGTLQLDTGNNRLPTGTAVTIADAAGATLDLDGNNQTIATLAGGGTNGGAVALGAGTLTVGNGSTTTFAGTIDGTGGLIKQGAGVLILSGANTYAGATAINAGTLRISGSADRLPTTTAVTLANIAGALLDLNGLNQTIGSLAGGGATGGNVALGAGILTVGDANTTAYAGVLSGTGGGLVKQGAGTLTISGVNTYTGATTIDLGTLALGASNVIADASTVHLNGGFLDLNSRSETVASLTDSGTGGTLKNSVVATTSTFTLANAADTFTGSILSGSPNGIVNIVKSAPGSFTIDSAATVSVGSFSVLGGAFTLAVGTTLTAANNVTINAGTMALDGAIAGTLVVAGTPTVTVGTGASVTIADLTAGTGTVDATNPLTITSTLRLSGNITGSGTQITAKGSNIVNDTQTGAQARTLTIAGGTFTLAAAATPANLNQYNYRIVTGADSGISSANTYTHAIDFGNSNSGAAVSTINGVAFNNYFGASMPGSQSGPNGHPGGNNANFDPGIPPATYPALNTLFNDFRYNSDTNNVVLTGLTPGTFYETRLYMRTWDLTSADRRQQFDAFIGNSVTPQSTWTVNEDNPLYASNTAAWNTLVTNNGGFSTGTAWSMGYVFQADAAGKFTLRATALVANSTLHLYGLTNQVVPVAAATINLPNTNIVVTGSATFNMGSGVTNNVLGSLTLPNTATALTIGAAADITFNGITSTGAGNQISGPTELGLNSGSSIDATGDLTIGSAIGDTAAATALAKVGAGTLVLSGTNTYTGATSVTAGTLRVNGSLDSPGGAVTVDNAGSVLGGTGEISRAVTINAGASLAPGASIGTLGVNNDLTLGGISSFEVTGGSGPLGASDLVDGIGVLTYGGTLKITNVGAAFALGDSWDLFNDFTSHSGSFANTFPSVGDGINLPSLTGGLAWSFDYATGVLSVISGLAAPTVTSIVPAIGPTTGGTMLLINGSDFVSITTVTIDGVPLATFSVSGTTQISVTTPVHAAGAVNVVVTNAGGSGSLAGTSDFTYATPAVTSVVVNGGPGVFLGGTSWSLAGQNSVVKQILVTFNQAVTVASDAFTVTPVPVSVNPGPGVVVVNGGASPSSNAATTSVTMLTASTYLVTFVDDSGDPTPSTHAGGILNSGVYDLTIDALKVTANTEPLASNHETTFFAMFGTIDANNSYTAGTIGDGFSNAFVDPGSLFQFSDAFGSSAATPVGPPAYNIVFDSNLDGFIDPGDLFAFSDAFGIDWDF